MTEKDMGPYTDMDPALEEKITRYGTPPVRKNVVVDVRDVVGWSFDELPGTPQGMIGWLEQAISDAPEQYRDHLRLRLMFESGSYDEGSSARLEIWYGRPETDEEMCERVDRGLAYVRSQERKEREAYEALKAKYDPRPSHSGD